MTTHLRTPWLSDVHLGTAAARAGELKLLRWHNGTAVCMDDSDAKALAAA